MTITGAATYSAHMFRRGVALLFVSIWLALLAIEFCEDVGLIEYEGPEMDRAVETTLASFGEAIKLSGDEQPAVFSALFIEPTALQPLVLLAVSFKWISEGTELSRNGIPIYKLHSVFLI